MSLERRLVTLVGEDGIGKSALSAAVCAYMADRVMFEDGVIFVRAQGLQGHLSFLQMLQHAVCSGPVKLAKRFMSLSETASAAATSAGGSTFTMCVTILPSADRRCFVRFSSSFRLCVDLSIHSNI